MIFTAFSLLALILLLEKLRKPGAELLITEFPLDAGAGLADGLEIILVGEHARMQGPLPAPPGFAFMHRAAFVEKDTVAVHDLHLHHVAGNAQVFLPHLGKGEMQIGDQPRHIIGIKGNRGFALAAMAALPALKYFLFLNHINHLP
jgi:hypothetical protein